MKKIFKNLLAMTMAASLILGTASLGVLADGAEDATADAETEIEAVDMHAGAVAALTDQADDKVADTESTDDTLDTDEADETASPEADNELLDLEDEAFTELAVTVDMLAQFGLADEQILTAYVDADGNFTLQVPERLTINKKNYVVGSFFDYSHTFKQGGVTRDGATFSGEINKKGGDAQPWLSVEYVEETYTVTYVLNPDYTQDGFLSNKKADGNGKVGDGVTLTKVYNTADRITSFGVMYYNKTQEELCTNVTMTLVNDTNSVNKGTFAKDTVISVWDDAHGNTNVDYSVSGFGFAQFQAGTEVVILVTPNAISAPIEPSETPDVTDPVGPSETPDAIDPVGPSETPDATDPVGPSETPDAIDPVGPAETTPVYPSVPTEPEDDMTILGEEIPLSAAPATSEDRLTDITGDDVPLADIPMDDVALDDSPKTGEETTTLLLWILLSISATGLVTVSVIGKKRVTE